jgi:hypothetical protein
MSNRRDDLGGVNSSRCGFEQQKNRRFPAKSVNIRRGMQIASWYFAIRSETILDWNRTKLTGRRPIKMKRGMMIFSAAALTFAMAGPVLAQYPTHEAVSNADYGYFDSHPDVARALRKDPSLIDNQGWVDEHPGLHEYLHNHPNVRHEMKSHPNRFMHRAEQYNKHHD